jgi:UDP-3-O-[3-hydroxymyristoyl] glucosamine N-acyltransferase
MELKNINSIKDKIVSDGYFHSLGHSVVDCIEDLLTFCDNYEYIQSILTNKNISSAIIKPEFIDHFKNCKIGLVISDDPRMDFFKIHNYLDSKLPYFESIIGKNNQIHESSIISSGNVKIGNNCIIEPNVVINPNVEIGDDVIIRAGSIIGGQGFQFWKNISEVLQIQHFGNTIIKNNVEVKELCTIHSAVFNWDSTIIGEFTKIDSHSHIGHSNKIGKKVYLCSHSNISGNSIIEDECYIGPGVNVPNRLTVGFKAKLTVGATITNDIMEGTTVSGNFAIPHDIYIKHIKSLFK